MNCKCVCTPSRPRISVPRPQPGDAQFLNYDDLKSVAKLNSSAQYADIMARVAAALDAPPDQQQPKSASLEDDPTYK